MPDRLLHQTERLGELPSRRQDHRVRTQIQVVGSEVTCRTVRRTRSFSGLQFRLDNARNAYRDLILEIEHVVERAVETVGPEMCASFGLDQLRCDAHFASGLAHRALKHITDAQFATNTLYIDGLELVRERRIARDHE